MSPPQPSLDDLRIERGAPPAPRRTLPLVMAPITLGVVLAVVWWLMRPKPLEVRTAVAREVAAAGAERTVLNASGYVTARREATVSSKVTGKVTEILVEEGVKVDVDQVLARLDDTNVKGSVAAQADFDHAEAAAPSLRARLAQQVTAVTVADRTVAIWQQQLDDTVIRAPFAGIAAALREL